MVEKRLRNAVDSDISFIVNAKKEVFNKFNDIPLNAKGYEKCLKKIMTEQPDGVKILEMGGKKIGCVIYNKSKGNHGLLGKIQTLFITKEERANGYGKMLVEEGEKYFREQGIKRIKTVVSVKNKKSFSLLKETGFEKKFFVLKKILDD